MPKELTVSDLAHYQVTYMSGPVTNVQAVIAAYTTVEDRLPGWLLFKDHEHRTVAHFNANLVVMVQRGDPA
jgi:hypothetical protein